jgi:AcrR family transcriptional regulator
MNKGRQTRHEIVNGALSLAGKVGLEHVTLGVLATDLQLSKSGLYAHFKSKEALQLAVLDEAVGRFTAEVVRPAITAARGEPRFIALFERQLEWINGSAIAGDDDSALSAGRCIFMALSQEYDDRPGEVRDAVARSQRDWRGALQRAASIALSEGHFRPDLDVEQVAFEFVGIAMAFQQSSNLLADPAAERRARAAFDALLARCRHG